MMVTAPPFVGHRLHLTFTSLLLILHLILGQLSEDQRVDEYHARNHQWPPLPSNYIPDNSGWRSLFDRRFQQIAQIPDLDAKYNAYMSSVHSALLAPNFTEYGWALTRGPDGLVQDLLHVLLDGLESSEEAEVEIQQHPVSEEYPQELPLMISIGKKLNTRAMEELKPILEAWSGVKLIANNAYGLRVYRNQSKLFMHIDETSSHVISAILHVGHDPNGAPWPLVIEDLYGNTNEVYLETGDMLLYESSKCFHGRPKRYNGNWYSSLFIHYYPHDWDEDRIEMDTHYRIPPNWNEMPTNPESHLEKLVVMETSFKEPGCEHEWCGMKNTIKWERSERLEFGQFLSGDGEIRRLQFDEIGDEL